MCVKLIRANTHGKNNVGIYDKHRGINKQKVIPI